MAHNNCIAATARCFCCGNIASGRRIAATGGWRLASLLSAAEQGLGADRPRANQVAIVHDNRSPAYKAFGSAGLYGASEGDFYLDMSHLLNWAIAHVGAYAAQGLFKQTDVSKFDDYVIDPSVKSAGPVVPPVG